MKIGSAPQKTFIIPMYRERSLKEEKRIMALILVDEK